MKRREFLKKAAAVPAVVAASKWYTAAETLSRKPWEITAVVYDERYADCRDFAKALERQGAMPFATLGDAASLWYGALRASLARSGGSVAGMATDSDWVVSRSCGREQGLEVAYEGSHDWRLSDRLIHRLGGDGLEWQVYFALLDAKIPWARSIASGLVRCSHRDAVRIGSGVAIGKANGVVTRASTGHPGYLSSWLLVPGRPRAYTPGDAFQHTLPRT
jgi:hypothetical protein